MLQAATEASRPLSARSVGRRYVTIQDLGSIGEFIAAIATIVTLGYLAIQIRHLSNSTKAEAARGSSDGDPVVLALARDAELNRLFLTGLADYSALDPLEQARFAWVMGAMIGPAGRNFEHVLLGITTEDHFLNHARGQLMQLQTPGGSEFWRLYGHSFPPEFREFISRELGVDSPARTAVGGRAAQQAVAADQ